MIGPAEILDRLDPQLARLARVTSLAARVEPRLLRRLRLVFLPGSDAGLEADLYFSPLTRSHNVTSMVLQSEFVELLREQLSDPANREQLDRAAAVIEAEHRSAPSVIRLEEKVTWLALQGETAAEQLEAELMQAVRTLTEEDRPGMAQWVARALPRLPPRARQTKAAWLLALGAAARLGGREILGEGEEVEVAPELLRAVLPRGTQTAQIGVRLLADGIEFGDLRLPGAKLLSVPNTSPVTVDLLWSLENTPQEKLPAHVVFSLGSGKKITPPVVTDGQRVVTASKDGTARVWDAATGKPIGEPMKHEGIVTSAQFSPDGQRLVTASWDKTARLWDAASGKPIGEPMMHQNSVTAAQFSPDGQRVVTASEDGTARLWDAANGKPIAEPMMHQNGVTAVQFSPDGQRVVTASEDRRGFGHGQAARLWDAANGKPLGEPMMHQNSVTAAQFSPDGQRVVTASRDTTARLWNALSGKPLGEPMKHEGEVTSAQFSPDGQRVVTASEDGTARLWDAANGKPIGEPMMHQNSVTAAQFSPDGQRVVTASEDRRGVGHGQAARLWDAANGKPLGEPMMHQNSVTAAQFSPDGQRVVTASRDTTARLWNALSGKPLGEPMKHEGEVTSAQFSPEVFYGIQEIQISTSLGERHTLRPVPIAPAHSPSALQLLRRLGRTGPKRILAIDSGWMRCTIALQFLASIEEMLRERFAKRDLVLADYFDLIGGASTGGLFAAVLAKGASIEKLSAQWKSLGPRLFSKTTLLRRLQYKFDDSALNDTLAKMVGNDALNSPMPTGLCLLAKRADTGAIYSLVNHPESRDFAERSNVLLRDALRASMAAPTYFAPVPLELGPGESGIFMDSGASMMADPALHLLLVARLGSGPFRWTAGKEKLLLVSVGSGSGNNPPSVESAQNFNLVSWASQIPTILLQNGRAQTQRLLHWLAQEPHTVVSEATGPPQTPRSEAQMTYVRYDVALDSESLSKLGLSDLASRADSLQATDDPERLADFIAVGRAAADVQVKPSNFPFSFDVEFEAAESRREKMAEVFICYSRKDKEFVRRLDEELKRRDREAWVDWEGIPPGDTWEKTIYAAIEATHTFIFVLTPDSIASEVCGREIAHAAAHNKRIVPIVARDVNADIVPEPLAKLNWILCRDGDDFEKAVDALIRALDTDLNLVHAHRTIGNIKGSDIVEEDDGSVTFTAGAQLDGDGANGQFGEPPCYAPASYTGKTLDVLANAGGPGNWYGVVTDTGQDNGTPIVQGPNDPCPGAYVSATSLHLPGDDGKPLPSSSPFKYVDSATVPFVVVPPMIIKGVAGVVMGCRAVVTNTKNNKSVEAVVADGGPSNKLGEISLACAKAIGVPAGEGATHPANSGGIDASSHVIQYRLFPGVAAVVNGVTYPLQPS